MRIDYFNKEEKINVAIYARVSTEHEAQISALENQIQYYDNILKDHPNWNLYERYIDKGVTGTSMHKRDSFMRMIKDANDGKFNLILTREVSRFARNTAEALQQVRSLYNNNVGVYFIEDNIRTFDQSDEWELKLSLMATLAQNESKKISSRVKAGQKISFENGVFYGNGNILGYDRVDKNMVINKEQAETVKRIFELYLNGNGLRSIKFIMEQEGRKTSSGSTKWNAQVISRILKNKFYCGLIEYRKEYVPDYLVQKKIRNNGDVEKIVVKGTHQPIISEEDFNQVQEIFESKTRKVDGTTVGHQIAKDIYCRKLICECGRTFNKRRGYTTKSGEERYLYQCYDQLRNGTVKTRTNKGLDSSDCCTSITIPNWQLDITADWIFRKFFDNKQIIYEKTVQMLEEALNVSSTMKEIDDRINTFREKIKTLHSKYDALVDLYIDGNIPKDMYLIKKENFERSIQKEKKELEHLEYEKEKLQNENSILERKKKIADFLSVKAFDKSKKIPQELIEHYVDSIKVDSKKMTWILKIPDGTNFENVLNIYDEKRTKNKFSPVTVPENYELSSTLDRQLLTTNIIYQETVKRPKTLVNIGIFNISTNYFKRVKKYYFGCARCPRNEDFEVAIKIIV